MNAPETTAAELVQLADRVDRRVCRQQSRIEWLEAAVLARDRVIEANAETLERAIAQSRHLRGRLLAAERRLKELGVDPVSLIPCSLSEKEPGG